MANQQAGRLHRANMGFGGVVGGQAVGPPGVGSPVEVNSQRKSNLRFRSFAERYLVTRSASFRTDPHGLAEDTWACILDAKRAYHLIGNVGLNVQDD